MKKLKPPFYIALLFSSLLSACNSMMAASYDETTLIDDVDETEQGADPGLDLAPPGKGKVAVSKETVKPEKELSLDSDTLFNLLAAEFASNSGDTKTSLKYFRKASMSVEDSQLAARTAYIALYGKEYNEALQALDRWRELEPDAADLPKMYVIAYLKLGQPEKAVTYVKEILSSADGSEFDQAIAVKQLLAKEATTSDAYAVLQILNDSPDKNKHLLILQSRYAAQLKKYDESLAILDQVLEIDPSLHEVLIIKAKILTAQGKQQEATRVIKQLLDELPENNALRLEYARMLVDQQDLQAAIEQYSILYEKMPDDGDIALSLALLNIEAKHLDEAEDALKHLIDINKNVSIANYYLGRIAQNKGDDQQAIDYYQKVKHGDYAFDAQLRTGVLLAVLGKVEEGIAKLEVLAEEQTDWVLRVKSYLAQGEILRQQKRYKEGVEMFSRALQQKRDDTNLLYARGLMAEKVDRLDMAESDLLKVITKEPDNANALNALGYTLADRTSRYQEALDYIKRAADLVPDDPAILDSLGWVSYRLGKMDDALKWLSKAFEMLEDAEIAAHYGEVLWQTNQKDKAREIWNKGKSLNADNPVLVETLKRLKP
ncbi:MAG: tetratricopeptide repeat protein [Gammaproteobacteria bacterium]|jgi:tetratricopeptide (TPR) repeat protein|nr:tetratricopeptide repeat protein [Gammaproteobacteria bacterium]